MMSKWIIKGISSGPAKPLYWSKTDGWVNFYGATVFTTKEKDDNSDLPLAGQWEHVDVEADKREAEYLKNGGSKCLFCLSVEIDAGPCEADGDNMWCSVTCQECWKTWQDNYKLVGILEL